MTFDRRFDNAGILLLRQCRVRRRVFLDTHSSAFRRRRLAMARRCGLSFIRVGRNEKKTIKIRYYYHDVYPIIHNTIFLLPNTRRKSFFNYDKRQLCGTSQSDISRATLPPLQSNYLLRNWFFFFSTFVMDKSARPYNTIPRIYVYIYMYKK